MRDCVVFIMTHGRADRVYTFDSLRKHGYTGPIYLVIDTDDEQGKDYIKKYGRDNVLNESGALAVAPAQSGDFIGGAKGVTWKEKVRRKCMNLFFCKTDKPIKFIGRINEDVTTYTYRGQQGKLFFTVCDWHLHQKTTQAQAGGMTETYLDGGTYLKSFYSVMWMPSAVKICMMSGGGSVGSRIHHNVEWNNCVPKILNQKWKKVR